MSEIINYEIAFPKFRVSGQIMQDLHARKTQQCICYVDEDMITLSFSAASKLMTNLTQPDAILFATSTPVFKDRYHASFIADLLGLKNSILALDIISTARAGSDALLLTDKLIESGQYKNILLIAANVDFSPIGEEANVQNGHAAVAMMISSDAGVAEINSSYSFSSAFAENFLYKGERIEYDVRFSRAKGFKSNFEEAWNKTKLTAASTNQIILNSPYARMVLGLLKKDGFDIDKQLFKDSVISSVGYTGACHALLLIISAIENRLGKVSIFDYLNGINVINFNIKENPSTGKLSNLKFIEVQSYHDYLKLRKQGDFTDVSYKSQEMFSSEMLMEREKDSLLYLKAHQCKSCKSIYLIKIARCNKCHGTDFTEKSLQRTGTVYTLTSELYYPSSFPPINMIVIDLDGGGRITVQQTDDMYATNENLIKIGDRVELVYRSMIENDRKPNYFWKCIKL